MVCIVSGCIRVVSADFQVLEVQFLSYEYIETHKLQLQLCRRNCDAGEK